MKVHSHRIGDGLVWFDGETCAECGGPAEREAAMPPAPPLPCPFGCGLDLSQASHAEGSSCAGGPRWRGLAFGVISTSTDPAIRTDPLYRPPTRELPLWKVNGSK